MTTGHLGEWRASRIFGIDLHHQASHTGSDGIVNSDPLAGKPVNIKWDMEREGLLDISTSTPPDCVYLFQHPRLVNELGERGTKIGIASSVVVKAQWAAAEIFPVESSLLPFSEDQRTALGLLRDTR